MATLERELVELKMRVAQLEARVYRAEQGSIATIQPPAQAKPVDSERLLTWMKAEGLIRSPTPEEIGLADGWDTLPDEERQAHIQLMRNLTLDPPLSQMIIENRR